MEQRYYAILEYARTICRIRFFTDFENKFAFENLRNYICGMSVKIIVKIEGETFGTDKEGKWVWSVEQASNKFEFVDYCKAIKAHVFCLFGEYYVDLEEEQFQLIRVLFPVWELNHQ